MSGEKTNPLTVVGGAIVGIVVIIVSYFIWINSGSFDGSFFGMTFRLPFETVEHYCYRKTNHIFVVVDGEKEQCIKEENARQTNSNLNSSDRHTRLKGYIRKTFTDDNGRTVSDSQAECIAKSMEKYYNNSQIDRAIKGEKLNDEIPASVAFAMMGEISACVGL